eukprot:CAMPEP_0175954730 /NCGR_PEP_ID=MMETSP0108-20121206/32088_1 /TAXON_ID=195067 ORGANISM="Goniomonas pacifica, Strain CCMP1869" /NCGR_SAMPLE_ID=MMETSP0108 /ASSEMBLY_ACC=CAM_ASM_000204 /LENGTH=76 /DNA_ID=CAMNT_0017281473 /DNA_START=290 /DNA_END=516 /DNA_ORIENTATION=-
MQPHKASVVGIHQDLPTGPLRVELVRVLCRVRNGAEVGVGGWVIHQDLPTRPLRVGLIRVLCLVRNGAEVGVGGWV